MNIHNIFVTQRKLRNPDQLRGMIAAILRGESLPPIILVECDGIEIEDGHHRSIAYLLAGRDELLFGEYILVPKYLSKKRRFGTMKELLERMKMNAESLAYNLRLEYGLTYRCSVNLEGTINNLLQKGLSLQEVEDVVRDILDNIEWSDED